MLYSQHMKNELNQQLDAFIQQQYIQRFHHAIDTAENYVDYKRILFEHMQELSTITQERISVEMLNIHTAVSDNAYTDLPVPRHLQDKLKGFVESLQ